MKKIARFLTQEPTPDPEMSQSEISKELQSKDDLPVINKSETNKNFKISSWNEPKSTKIKYGDPGDPRNLVKGKRES